MYSWTRADVVKVLVNVGEGRIDDQARCRNLAVLRIKELALYTHIVVERIFDTATDDIADFVARRRSAGGGKEAIGINERIVPARISNATCSIDENPVEGDA